MELWLIIIILSNFFYGAVFVVDKFLLSKKLPALVYTFLVAILGGSFGLALIPWINTFPNFYTALIILLIDASFIFALFLFYSALNKGEALRVAPLIGGLKPILIIIIAKIFIQESLDLNQFFAVIIVIIAGIILAIPDKRKSSKKAAILPILLACFASLFFAIHDSFLKLIYNDLEFWQGFFWARMGFIVIPLIFLLIPGFIKTLKTTLAKSKSKKLEATNDLNLTKTTLLFIGAQSMGALAFILFNYAIKIGQVSIVNSLQGMQYAFLFIFIIILTRFDKFKPVFKESLNKKVFIQKTIAISLIIVGVILLAI